MAWCIWRTRKVVTLRHMRRERRRGPLLRFASAAPGGRFGRLAADLAAAIGCTLTGGLDAPDLSPFSRVSHRAASEARWVRRDLGLPKSAD
jgi:hypothetical protein